MKYAWNEAEKAAIAPGTPLQFSDLGSLRYVLFRSINSATGKALCDIGGGRCELFAWDVIHPYTGAHAQPLDAQFHELLTLRTEALRQSQRALHDLKLECMPLRQSLSTVLHELFAMTKRVADLEEQAAGEFKRGQESGYHEGTAVFDTERKWHDLAEALGVEGGMPDAPARCLSTVRGMSEGLRRRTAQLAEAFGAELRRTVREAADNPGRTPEQSGNANACIALLARFADLFGGQS